MHRRDFLARAGCLATAASTALAGPLVVAGTPAPRPHRRLADTHQALLPVLAELIIPRTDTPGAIEAGVPAFMHEVLTTWLTDTEFAVFTEGLAWLDREAQTRHGRAFIRCTETEHVALLETTEVQARDWHRAHPVPVTTDSVTGKAPIDERTPFFTRLKEIVSVGYFTSEVATNATMVYLPIPMRYTGEASLAESGGKPYAW